MGKNSLGNVNALPVFLPAFTVPARYNGILKNFFPASQQENSSPKLCQVVFLWTFSISSYLIHSQAFHFIVFKYSSSTALILNFGTYKSALLICNSLSSQTAKH